MHNCECKGCSDRFVGCHAICEKYLLWKEEHDKEKANIFEQQTKERMLADIKKDAIKRMIKSVHHYSK